MYVCVCVGGGRGEGSSLIGQVVFSQLFSFPHSQKTQIVSTPTLSCLKMLLLLLLLLMLKSAAVWLSAWRRRQKHQSGSESIIGGENTKGVNMKVKTTSSPLVKEFWSGRFFCQEHKDYLDCEASEFVVNGNGGRRIDRRVGLVSCIVAMCGPKRFDWCNILH